MTALLFKNFLITYKILSHAILSGSDIPHTKILNTDTVGISILTMLNVHQDYFSDASFTMTQHGFTHGELCLYMLIFMRITLESSRPNLLGSENQKYNETSTY